MLNNGAAKPRELTIAVRAYATPAAKSSREKTSSRKKSGYSRGLNKPSKWTVVFDTETSVDAVLTLRFGVYHVYRDGVLYEKGLFFEQQPKSSKILTGADIALIEAYASDKWLCRPHNGRVHR